MQILSKISMMKGIKSNIFLLFPMPVKFNIDDNVTFVNFDGASSLVSFY